MVAKTWSAQATGVGVGVDVGVAEGLAEAGGEGTAAGPQAEAMKINSGIAASGPRCIVDITPNSRLSLFRPRRRSGWKGQAPGEGGLGEREGKRLGEGGRHLRPIYPAKTGADYAPRRR